MRETAEQVARDEEASIQEGIDSLVADMAVDIDESARDKLRQRMSAIGQAHAQRAIQQETSGRTGPPRQRQGTIPQGRTGRGGRSQGQRQGSRGFELVRRGRLYDGARTVVSR